MISPSRYGVRLTKGPVARLKPHPDACETEEELVEWARTLTRPLVADLFCGAGGLSLGLESAGFTSVLGVDIDEQSLDTFRSLFGGLAWSRDLSDESDAIAEVASLIKRLGVTAIVGGPPCQPFSRAGRSGIRSLVERGIRDAHDHRRDLWQSFLEIVARVRPLAIIMENVPDLALGNEGIILRLMTHELEEMGYSVESRIVEAWRYGVPQHRQRLILVALHRLTDFEWPRETGDLVTVGSAIGDLPEIRGGWDEAGDSDGYLEYDGPRTAFQVRARAGMPEAWRHRVYDHVTRAVREDDRVAFSRMDATTSYTELDPELKRYREDIFDDKYKRLDENGLSRSIIAHLAKDGYGFIHPTQDRTISVREAARLQTFPDHVRFAGPPTAAFRQIGNAVPPLLAEHIGRAVLGALEGPPKGGRSTIEVSTRLAAWFREEGSRSQPWLDSDAGWPIVMGEALLARADSDVIRSLWPLLENFDTPRRTVEAKHTIAEIAGWISRPAAARALAGAAALCVQNPELLTTVEGLASLPGVTHKQARLIALASPRCDEDIVYSDRGVLRVAARVTESNVDQVNERSDGRIAVSRMVGVGETGRQANLALVELARSVCTPERPRCPVCPLIDDCAYAVVEVRRRQPLPLKSPAET